MNLPFAACGLIAGLLLVMNCPHSCANICTRAKLLPGRLFLCLGLYIRDLLVLFRLNQLLDKRLAYAFLRQIF
ncbi:hypothetical protein AZH46_04095 [Corynebacterium striatum]|nr:hypothetical protein AZH46_04095 [Corynebacterium striatum]